MNMMKFIVDKGNELEITKEQLIKDIHKKYDDNKIWRHQYKRRNYRKNKKKESLGLSMSTYK